jgi:hypothetical protein
MQRGFGGKTEERKPLRRTGLKREGNIKIDAKATG